MSVLSAELRLGLMGLGIVMLAWLSVRISSLHGFVAGPGHSALRVAWDAVWILVAPPLCFMFDPVVFGAHGVGGLLQPLRLPTYSAWLIAAVAFSALFLRALPSGVSVVRTGALVSGGTISLGMGIVLLPYSTAGLMVGIGAFGFVPFVTAAALFRCAKVSQPVQLRGVWTAGVWGWLAVGFLFVPISAGLLALCIMNISR